MAKGIPIPPPGPTVEPARKGERELFRRIRKHEASLYPRERRRFVALGWMEPEKPDDPTCRRFRITEAGRNA